MHKVYYCKVYRIELFSGYSLRKSKRESAGPRVPAPLRQTKSVEIRNSRAPGAQCSAMADHTHGRLTSRACEMRLTSRTCEMRHSCGSRITAASCTHSTQTCSAGTLLRVDDDRPLPRGRARAAETALGPWASESRSASSMSLHPSAEAACTFPSSSSSRRGHRFSCRPSSPTGSPTITALPAASSPSHRPLPPRPAQPWSEHQQHGSLPGAPARLRQPSKPNPSSTCPHPYPNPILP